jgi:hemerythrin superfamily protein
MALNEIVRDRRLDEAPTGVTGAADAIARRMNAIKLLKQQHDEVDELIETIEKAKSSRAKEAAFLELADKLAAHAKVEESLFYPAVMAKQTEDMLLESVEEHLQIKRVLADLLDLDIDDEHFDAKLSVMKEEIEHHAREEEEGDLFPKVKKLFSADELEGLGNDMMAMFETLLTGAPRKSVPSETDKAASLPSP